MFRVRGILLAVHASFFLLLAYVGFEAWRDGGWTSVAVNVATLLVFFTCVVLHELGHCFTAMAFGVGVRRILLMPIGGMAEFDGIPREPGRELLVALAGPAVNVVLAGILFPLVGFPPGWHLFGFENYPDTLQGFLQLLLHWNVLMVLLNLLPIFPMDGGRVLRAALATHLTYVRATYWAATVGQVLALAAAGLALILGRHYLTAALFVFIFFAGQAEHRAVQRRETHEAEWREMLERMYGHKAGRG